MENKEPTADELKPNPKQKLPEIGPPLKSRSILPGKRREQFPFGKLATKGLHKEVKFVQDQKEALKEAEKEVFYWRHRHKNTLDTFKRQAMAEINMRIEMEKRHHHYAGLVSELRSIRNFIIGLK